MVYVRHEEKTLGKTVTLRLGAVVTDVGAGTRNGKTDPGLRRVVADDGTEYVVLARVVRDLPETYRRETLDYAGRPK